MEKYLKSWLDIISGMANENTYKLAWDRGIIESILAKEYNEHSDYIEVSFSVIAEKMLKYYWNQEFYFKLQQGPNSNKKPVILQITQELIYKYTKEKDSMIPVWYDKAKGVVFKDDNYHQLIIKKLVKAVSQDVCWRFLKVRKEIEPVYVLDKENKLIKIEKKDLEIIKQYGIILMQLLNYRWAQLLEQFNKSPKIASKVKGLQENKIKRNNLNKYKEELLKQFEKEKPVCFYTGDVIEEKDISVDHVIPWSFIYSDDLWNLVLTTKSYNSSKSNSIPEEKDIKKLIQRNKYLTQIDIKKSEKQKIINALENNWIDKYYLDIRV